MMVEACREAGVPLRVGYYRRERPRFLGVRELVDSGAIGPIRMIVTRMPKRFGHSRQTVQRRSPDGHPG